MQRCRRCPNPLTPSPASFPDRSAALHDLRGPAPVRPPATSLFASCAVPRWPLAPQCWPAARAPHARAVLPAAAGCCVRASLNPPLFMRACRQDRGTRATGRRLAGAHAQSAAPACRCGAADLRAQAACYLMRGPRAWPGGRRRSRHAPLARACSRLWCVRAPQSHAGTSSCAGLPDAPLAFKVLLWALSPVCACVLDARHPVEGLHWGTILSRQRHGDPTHGRHPGNLRVRVHENLGISYAI